MQLGLQITLVVTSILVVLLVLLHRAKGGGLSTLFGGGVQSSLSGSTVVEKNLDRLTLFITGIWLVENFVAFARPTEEKRMKTMEGQPVPFQDWSGKLYEERLQADHNGAAFPYTASRCLPGGVPQMMYSPIQFQITQSPGQVTMLMEEQHLWRQILLREPHDPDPLPGYHGDSTGKWEGDTLVVDTVGFNDQGMLEEGVMHTEKLHMTARYRLTTLGGKRAIQAIYTYDDPGSTTKTLKFARVLVEANDQVDQEAACNENNKSH